MAVDVANSWSLIERHPCASLPIPNLHLAPISFCLFVFKKCVFIWLHQVVVAACGIEFPDEGWNLNPLHWECRVLATVPPGKSLYFLFNVAHSQATSFPLGGIVFWTLNLLGNH